MTPNLGDLGGSTTATSTPDFDQTVTAQPDPFGGYPGYAQPQHAATEFGGDAFVIQALLGRLATTALVQVVAVTNNGGLSPVGFVDVTPMVNQMDSQGNPTPHGVIHNLPYMRVQGGVSAVILDPVVGDIGVSVFCSRDISTVKRTKAVANPGSARQFDWADGLYVGGYLNAVPQQFVQFNSDGISIMSPTAIVLQAPNVTITGANGITLVSTSGTIEQNAPNVLVNSDTTTVVATNQVAVSGNLNTTGILENNGHLVGSTHEHTASGGTGVGGPPV